MTNKQLQSIITNYPDECEIVILECTGYDYKIPVGITTEYDKDNDFKASRIVIEVDKIED